MSFAELKQNKAVAAQLASLLKSSKLVHAYLFVGGKESRLQMGKALAAAILCGSPRGGDACGTCLACRKFAHGNHEDYLYTDLETAPGNAKTQIGVDAVEALQEQLKLKPFGSRHVAVIEEAHLLNTAAQNKLLKTLEEPAGDSVIILLAEKKEALLPTVVSRCSTYFLEDEAVLPENSQVELARAFFTLCAGRSLFYQKRDCLKPVLEEKNDPRAKAASFLECLLMLLRDALLSPYAPDRSPVSRGWDAFEEVCARMDPEKLIDSIHAVEEAIRSVRLGYNTGYTLKKLCLDLSI
jgi:hypothetical protein